MKTVPYHYGRVLLFRASVTLATLYLPGPGGRSDNTPGNRSITTGSASGRFDSGRATIPGGKLTMYALVGIGCSQAINSSEACRSGREVSCRRIMQPVARRAGISKPIEWHIPTYRQLIALGVRQRGKDGAESDALRQISNRDGDLYPPADGKEAGGAGLGLRWGYMLFARKRLDSRLMIVSN